MFKSVKNFAHDSGLKYALIAALIAVFTIATLQLVGVKTGAVYTELGNTMN